jgi:hypothetical protein
MGWIIYFWAYAILLGTAYYILYFEGSPVFWDYVDFPISAIAMAGVFCFAYKIKFLSLSFWKVWLFVIISWDLTYNILFTKILGVAQETEKDSSGLLLTIAIWLLVLLKYAALYFYSHRSSGIWATTHQTSGVS